jgi:hypothetical protein
MVYIYEEEQNETIMFFIPIFNFNCDPILEI